MSIQIKEKVVAVVDGVEHEVVYEFELATPDWVCDSKAYIVSIDSKLKLVMSDHGRFEVIDDFNDIPVLRDYISSYRQLIEYAEKAIELLKNSRRGQLPLG